MTKEELLKGAAQELGQRGWKERRKALKEEHGDTWREEHSRVQAEYGKLRGLSDEERLKRAKEIRECQKKDA